MTTQPPDSALLDRVIEQGQVDLDETDFARLINLTRSAWEQYADAGYNRAKMACLALVYVAARIRQGRFDSKLADYLDRAAEAALIGWVDEVQVQSAVIALEEL